MKQQAFVLIASLVVIALVLIYFYRRGYEGFDGGAGGTTTLTMYYVDWCPHCKSAKPDFEALSAESPLDINGQKVAITLVNPEKTPDAAKGKPIKGYPTVLLTKSSGEVVEYDGPREKDGYLSFLKSNV